MLREVEFKNSTEIVRDWLVVKYQVVNHISWGISLSFEYGKPKLLYDYTYPGTSVFTCQTMFEKMKEVGYFIGGNGIYMGEGAIAVTEKTLTELELEKKQIATKAETLRGIGYQLFMHSDEINKEIDGAYKYYSGVAYGMDLETKARWRIRYLQNIFGLYLIPENEVSRIEPGTLLVSSVDGKEVLSGSDTDWSIKDGFSAYGIRLMPQYADELLFTE